MRRQKKQIKVMQLKSIGSNQTEIQIGQTRILFSYNTPVAAMNLTPEFHAEHGSGLIRTSKKWSATTSKHINAWCGGSDCGKQVEQSVLDNLAN